MRNKFTRLLLSSFICFAAWAAVGLITDPVHKHPDDVGLAFLLTGMLLLSATLFVWAMVEAVRGARCPHGNRYRMTNGTCGACATIRKEARLAARAAADAEERRRREIRENTRCSHCGMKGVELANLLCRPEDGATVCTHRRV